MLTTPPKNTFYIRKIRVTHRCIAECFLYTTVGRTYFFTCVESGFCKVSVLMPYPVRKVNELWHIRVNQMCYMSALGAQRPVWCNSSSTYLCILFCCDLLHAQFKSRVIINKYLCCYNTHVPVVYSTVQQVVQNSHWSHNWVHPIKAFGCKNSYCSMLLIYSLLQLCDRCRYLTWSHWNADCTGVLFVSVDTVL